MNAAIVIKFVIVRFDYHQGHAYLSIMRIALKPCHATIALQQFNATIVILPCPALPHAACHTLRISRIIYVAATNCTNRNERNFDNKFIHNN